MTKYKLFLFAIMIVLVSLLVRKSTRQGGRGWVRRNKVSLVSKAETAKAIYKKLRENNMSE